jgi:DNA-binding Lrp family transcriptional regulator
MAAPSVNAGLETVTGSGRARSARGWPSPDEHAASLVRLSTSSHRMARSLAQACPGGGEARGSLIVVTAYILVQTEVGKAAQVAEDIVGIEGVQLAEDVTRPYDVIVRAEARNIDELGKLVVARVQAVDGITRTLTCPVVHL